MRFEFEPIGIIHTPFTERGNTPVQPAEGAGIKGTVEVFEEYRPALKDLDGFSHIVLIWVLHRSEGYSLQVVPHRHSEIRGLFATRSPNRPNPIGLSVVRLDSIDEGILHIRDVDMLEGSPLLDIKPWVPESTGGGIRAGWLEESGKTAEGRGSDGRLQGED